MSLDLSRVCPWHHSPRTCQDPDQHRPDSPNGNGTRRSSPSTLHGRPTSRCGTARSLVGSTSHRPKAGSTRRPTSSPAGADARSPSPGSPCATPSISSPICRQLRRSPSRSRRGRPSCAPHSPSSPRAGSCRGSALRGGTRGGSIPSTASSTTMSRPWPTHSPGSPTPCPPPTVPLGTCPPTPSSPSEPVGMPWPIGSCGLRPPRRSPPAPCSPTSNPPESASCGRGSPTSQAGSAGLPSWPWSFFRRSKARSSRRGGCSSVSVRLVTRRCAWPRPTCGASRTRCSPSSATGSISTS